jgi:hypothetical protein
MVAPSIGSIVVSVTTAGPEPDPDGYNLSLDGRQGVPIGTAETRTLRVDAGSHQLELSGLSANCRVGGDGPSRTVTVPPNDSVPVPFAVECHATAGAIRVVISTSGNATDPDGYAVVLDDEAPRPVAADDTLELTALAVGDHHIRLLELSEFCNVAAGDTRIASVAAGAVVEVRFEVVCQEGVSRWTPMESGSEADLTDVWGTSGTDVFTVGEITTEDENGFELASVVLHFEGTAWSLQRRIRDVTLRGVWASSAADAWAVGFDFFDDDAQVLHYDGTQWTSQPGFEARPEESIGLEAVWGSSASDVFAVGSTFDGEFDSPLIFHYDGEGWERMTLPDNARPSLTDVWGSSPTDVYAVGADQREDPSEGTVLHFDGVGWSPVYQEPGLTLNSVWGSTATDVFVAGFTLIEAAGESVASGAIRHFDGHAWVPVTIPETGVLNQLWGNSASDVFAVGEGGVILHYNGESWTASTPADEILLGIWSSAQAEAFAVGIAGTILHGTP